MPIVVDPSFVPPAPPSTVESSDLRLTARSDPDHAGAFLMASFAERVLRRNLITNPAFRAASGTVEVRRNAIANPNAATVTTAWGFVGSGSLTQDTATASPVAPTTFKLAAAAAGDVMYLTTQPAAAPGDVFTASVYVKGTGSVQLAIARSPGGAIMAQTAVTPVSGAWTRVTVTATMDATTTQVYVLLYQRSAGANTVNVGGWLLEKSGGALLPYFDGSTPAADGLTYAWTGTANLSASTATGTQVTGWTPKLYRGGDGASGRVTGAGIAYSPVGPGAALGQWWAGRITLWAPEAGTRARLALHDGTTYVADAGWVDLPGPGQDPAEFAIPATVALQNTGPRLYVYPEGSKAVHLSRAIMERVAGVGDVPGSYFDGSTPTADPIRRRWAGAADASTSEEFVPALVNGKGDLPERVRFCRGDDSLVRSGDTALAPGGVAVAYDHGAKLGRPVSWYAVPIWRDGTEGSPTEQTALELPDPTGATTDVWLKSVLEPDKSVRLWLTDPPKMARAGRVDTQAVRGARNPAASWDTRSGYATTFAVATSTPAERKALEAVLDTGPLLFQASSLVDVDDFYLLPGDVEWGWGGGSTDHLRVWTITAVEVDPPATLDAPLVVPDLSWDTVRGDYASWDQLVAQEPSWLALLGW